MTDFGRTKTLNVIKKLIDDGYATKIGSGRSTKYRVAKNK